MITDSAFAFLKSTHDIAVMARHRYTLRELTAKLATSHFSIQKSTYLYFTLFPLVVFSRLMGKASLRFSLTAIHSDLKETNPYINKLLTVILRWEGSFLRIAHFPWGSSLLILGQRINHGAFISDFGIDFSYFRQHVLEIQGNFDRGYGPDYEKGMYSWFRRLNACPENENRVQGYAANQS